MTGWNHGMDAGWWILMSVFWVAIIGLAIWAIMRLVPGRGGDGGSAGSRGDTPEEILDRRLARGEIDVEEYRRVKETLHPQAGGGS